MNPKPNTLYGLEYLFTNVYNFRNTLYDFVKHIKPPSLGTHDTLQARTESHLSISDLAPTCHDANLGERGKEMK